MNRTYPWVLFVISAVVAQAAPYIGYVYPAGGQQGTTLQLLVGGSGILLRNDFGHFSGTGITVRDIAVVPRFPNPSGDQRQWLLTWLEGIEKGKKARPPLPAKKETDVWRKNEWWDRLDTLDALQRNLVLRSLLTRPNKLQAAPSIQQVAIVTVDIAADAPPGRREFRLWNSVSGVSVPRQFYVSEMPHRCEPRFVALSRPQPPLPTMTTVPVAVDGQLMPGEVDAYTFALEKGKDYRFTARARALLPFIGDAVPGHCQLVLRLLDADQKERAFVDDVYFDPDPVLFFTPAVSGEYTLEVRDNLYRGREDFVYEVVLDYGRPSVKEYPDPLPNMPQVKYEALNRKPLDITQQTCVTGLIAQKGQQDTFHFSGRKGQVLVVEVIARRNASPLDSVLRLYDPDQVKIAEAEDAKQTLNIGAYLQHVDPSLSVTLPKDGAYRLVLSERTQGYGPDYRYWLRIGPPMPDFEVYSAVSFANIPAGSFNRVKFLVDRKEGFSNAVKIVCDAFIVTDNLIGPTNSEKFVSFKAKDERTFKPMPVNIFAEAVINGEKVRKPVTPSDEMMQAFAYNHLLPAENFYAMQYRPASSKKSKDVKKKKK